MVSSRLRSAAFAAILALVSMLAMVLSWSTLAESAPQTQAAPKSGVANIQLLGVNDFHGNLEPLPTNERT
jgi:2',3'-cyclic-nucleotide 2'-phosphodiesterase (5'-nucleotidase family)